ncbi:MAG: AraC family transcriptional regulator [Epulopiscium sp.]|nr:AraC family transcriptional regulator [Candidatus Epulonipiscium sp.]
MCDLGITPQCFNPKVFYVVKKMMDREIDYHCHDHIELHYILSGSCVYKINDNLYTVKKGDIIVLNPNIHHKNILSEEQETLEFLIGFTNIYIKNLPKNHLINESDVPIIHLLKYHKEFFETCNSILLEQQKGDPGNNLMLKALVMKCIILLLRETLWKEQPIEFQGCDFESSNKTYIVNRIISFINENYMGEISLGKIANNMYLSSVYISKIFKEETGESPINYLIKTRLKKALEIMETSDLSIKEIAKKVGYSDAYYFSKLFKKYYGYPPSRHKSLKKAAP